MTHDEYLQKIRELEEDFKDRKVKLMKHYVWSNNTYKPGDIITDHIGSIKFETFGYSWGINNKPEAIYHGIELKKDGTPKNNRNSRSVFQRNIIK